MANWSTLKAAISDTIKTNGNQEITGQLLQNVLNNIVSTLGQHRPFAGIATPGTNPGAPDGPVFYIAHTAGTYSNFDGYTLEHGLIGIITNEFDGRWSLEKIDIVSEINDSISSVVEDIDDLYNRIDSLVLNLSETDKDVEYTNSRIDILDTRVEGNSEKIAEIKTNEIDPLKEDIKSLADNCEANSLSINELGGYIDDVDAAVGVVESIVESENKQFNVPGYYYSADSGTIVANNAYVNSGFIPINHKHNIEARATGTAIVAILAIFDINKNAIYLKAPSGNASTLVDTDIIFEADNIPKNAAYFVVSTVKNKAAESYWSNGPTDESRENAVVDLVQQSKMALFIDRWNTLCGVYGKYDPNNAPDSEHPFTVNDLWLTYDEALEVVENGVTKYPRPAQIGSKCRTNIYASNGVSFGLSMWYTYIQTLCNYATNLEVVRVSPDGIPANIGNDSFSGVFYNTPKLRKVLGQISLSNHTAEMTHNAFGISSVEDVSIINLRRTLDLYGCPNLNVKSVQTMVSNVGIPVDGTGKINIIYRANVYDKMTKYQSAKTQVAISPEEVNVFWKDGKEIVNIPLQVYDGSLFSIGDKVEIVDSKALDLNGNVIPIQGIVATKEIFSSESTRITIDTYVPLDEDGVASFDTIPVGSEVIKVDSGRIYLPLNIADGHFRTEGHSANVSIIDSKTIEITRQQDDSYFEFAFDSGMLITLIGQRIVISFDIENGHAYNGENLVVSCPTIGENETNFFTIDNNSNGIRHGTEFTSLVKGKFGVVKFNIKNTSASYQEVEDKIRLSNIKICYANGGELGDYDLLSASLRYTPTLPEMEDDIVRENTQWANIPIEAVTRKVIISKA